MDMANVSESNDNLIWGELHIRLPKNLLEEGRANENEGSCFKKIIPLCGEKFVVGRADGCNYQLMKKLVSSRHCYLKQESGKVYIHDTSRNGTFINRTKKLTYGEYHILKDNDEIYLISKKGDPHTDFCLIYKSQTFFTSNIEPSTSSDEPSMKRIKLEQIDGLTNTCCTVERSLSLNPAEIVSDDEVIGLNTNDVCGNYRAVLIKNSPKTPPYQNDSDATIAYENDSTPKSVRGQPLESDLEPATDSDSADTLPIKGSSCNEASDIDHGTPEKSGIERSPSREIKKSNLPIDSISSRPQFNINELPNIDDDSSVESLNIPLLSNGDSNELNVQKQPEVDGANVEKSVTVRSISKASTNSHNDINKGEPGSTPVMSLPVKIKLLELDMPDAKTSNSAPNIIDTIKKMDNASGSNNEKNEGCNSPVHKDLPKKDGMEETLQCSLCIDILHEPVCLQPCLHCYCAGCYSQWMEKSSCCPQCRVFVESVSKNHIVSNMVEEYLKANPGKKRSEGDIQKLNEANVIAQDVMKFSKQDEKVPDYDDENSFTDGSDNESHDSYDFSLGFPGFVLRLPTSYGSAQRCRQCPDPTEKDKKRRNSSKKGAKNQCGASTDASNDVSIQPSTSTSTSNVGLANEGKTDYVCLAKQVHISCQCCQALMPDRTTNRVSDNSIPPQSCSQCFSTYCNLYFDGGCGNAACKGCLVLFKDLKFSDLELVRAINDNAVETRILLDYLTSRTQTWSECFSECLVSLDSGEFSLVPVMNSKSIVCHDCALRQLKNLFFTYRKQIPASLLPHYVKQRPDCYWGKNCRTQKHRMTHAERYNHICEQTRFNH